MSSSDHDSAVEFCNDTSTRCGDFIANIQNHQKISLQMFVEVRSATLHSIKIPGFKDGPEFKNCLEKLLELVDKVYNLK